MNKPLVAIVGRPNVGKSTLFNRIVGRRVAIVEDTAGITRDRIYAESDWNGIDFVIVDTGGIILNDKDLLKHEVTQQAKAALEEADVVLFIVDVISGVTPEDKNIANILRSSSKPVIIVANKADNDSRELDANEFYELGMDLVYPVSSLNGRCVGDLLDKIVEAFPKEEKESQYNEDAIKIAIVGRPNVGKSSLLNAIIGKNRVIVSDIPGTTRDAIDTMFIHNENKVVLIDTAGIRRSSKIQGTIEYYTVLRAIRAMERAEVALIVIDASEGLCDGDKRVAGFAHEAGRACVVIVNKWDLYEGLSMREYADEIKAQMPFLDFAPVVFTSAKTGMGVTSVLDTAIEVAANHALRVSTSDLNKVIQDAVDDHPYSRKGHDLKVKYATMSSVQPPTIIIFVNNPELIHFSYERYIENQIRRAFSFEGTPLRIFFRKAKKERKS